MKTRRLVFAISLAVVILSMFVLSGEFVQNPTGRRYSADFIDLSLNNQNKGLQGEAILAQDLRIDPTNETGSQSQCLCGLEFEDGKTPPNCDVCVLITPEISTWRIPDFMTNRYIAESKNVRELLSNGREYAQIQDMAISAQMLNRPIWLYVRTDSYIHPDYADFVNATGGAVIYYFRTVDYVDVIGIVAWVVLIIAGSVCLIIFSWELLPQNYRLWITERTKQIPLPPAVQNALRSTDSTEDYMQQAERYSHDILDNDK